MRWVLAALLLVACSEDMTAPAPTPDAPPADPADAAPPPDSAPLPDDPPAPTYDAGPYPDGGVLVCGDKPLYDSCADGIECDSCLCFTSEGQTYCSQSCDGPEDCPAPSQGCNILHVCRPPPP